MKKKNSFYFCRAGYSIHILLQGKEVPFRDLCPAVLSAIVLFTLIELCMKLMKRSMGMMLALSVCSLAACSDDQDAAPLRRDSDAVELAYNADAATRVSVRYDGAWEARAECPVIIRVAQCKSFIAEVV